MPTKQLKINAISFALMVKALSEKPHSKPQLAELTGLHVWTIRGYVDALHRVQMAHITHWDKDGMGRDVTAYYSLGFGIDMPREQKTGAQKAREYRARQRRIALEAQQNK